MDVKREKRCQRFALKLLSDVCMVDKEILSKLYPRITISTKQYRNVTIYERKTQWLALVKLWPLDAGPFIIEVYNNGTAIIRSCRSSMLYLDNVEIDYSYGSKPKVRFIKGTR